MEKQVHIFYSGRVQGIGFRFTARELADELGVSGWVKNLSDARVELLIQGQEEILNNYLARIQDIFSGYIFDTQISWQDEDINLKNFNVRF